MAKPILKPVLLKPLANGVITGYQLLVEPLAVVNSMFFLLLAKGLIIHKISVQLGLG
jgi:hypothetical protein